MVGDRTEEVLTVIIPCLNEVGNVEGTVRDVLTVAARLPMRVEVLLIDDGSTDGTAERMKGICDNHAACRMRSNPVNRGLGRSVLSVLQELDPASWVTVVPGDNEFLFESIDAFVARRWDYDVILGYLQNPVIRSIRRRLASLAFIRVTSFLYGFNYRYLNGLKLYKAWVFKGIDVQSSGNAYVAELLAKAVLRTPMLRIGEAPFAARGRARGTSKAIRPWSILRAMRDVWVGKRSVNAYRKAVIQGPPVSGQRPQPSHPMSGHPSLGPEDVGTSSGP